MWRSILTDEDASKAKAEEEKNNSEYIVKYLEAENRRYKSELEISEYSKKSLIVKMNDLEKSKLVLQKELIKAKDGIRFETIAREGLAKKANTLEFENISLKEEKRQYLEENALSRRRLNEVAQALNLERSKRLKDIHEIDLLKRENYKLKLISEQSGEEALKANQSVIDKLQKTETVLELNESQKRVIDAQSEEISRLMSEILYLREELQRQLNISLTHETTNNQQREHEKKLDQEIWRLRKEILNQAHSQSQKSAAFRSLPSDHMHTTVFDSYSSSDYLDNNETLSSPGGDSITVTKNYKDKKNVADGLHDPFSKYSRTTWPSTASIDTYDQDGSVAQLLHQDSITVTSSFPWIQSKHNSGPPHSPAASATTQLQQQQPSVLSSPSTKSLGIDPLDFLFPTTDGSGGQRSFQILTGKPTSEMSVQDPGYAQHPSQKQGGVRGGDRRRGDDAENSRDMNTLYKSTSSLGTSKDGGGTNRKSKRSGDVPFKAGSEQALSTQSSLMEIANKMKPQKRAAAVSRNLTVSIITSNSTFTSQEETVTTSGVTRSRDRRSASVANDRRHDRLSVRGNSSQGSPEPTPQHHPVRDPSSSIRTNRYRTMYVGTGLGLKQSQLTAYEPSPLLGGSTRQMLERILAKHDEEKRGALLAPQAVDELVESTAGEVVV